LILQSSLNLEIFIMETNFPALNVHDLVFESYLTQECPMFLANKLANLFRVAFMVFYAGNVHYNAVLLSNTLMLDFFMKNHRLFARGLGFEFIDKILIRLLSNIKYWDFMNTLNIHLFYLSHRPKMVDVLHHHMARLYGSFVLDLFSHRLSSPITRNEDFSFERGILHFIFSLKDFLVTKILILFLFLDTLTRAWTAQTMIWLQNAGEMYHSGFRYDEAILVIFIYLCFSLFLFFISKLFIFHCDFFSRLLSRILRVYNLLYPLLLLGRSCNLY
jgi:hypothetical protein